MFAPSGLRQVRFGVSAALRDPLSPSTATSILLSSPAWPHPSAVSARARRIQRLTRGKSLRGTYSRA